MVCDSENVCFFTRSLYLAEEQLEGDGAWLPIPLLNQFPQSTRMTCGAI